MVRLADLVDEHVAAVDPTRPGREPIDALDLPVPLEAATVGGARCNWRWLLAFSSATMTW